MTTPLTLQALQVLHTLDLPHLPDAEKVAVILPDVVLGGYLWPRFQAPRLVLLHGWGGDAHSMLTPARLFAQAGWCVLSLSLRGWRGSSGCDDYGRSGPRDVKHVLDWLNDLTDAHQPLVLLGFSMGAMMTLLTVTTQETPVTHAVSVSAPTDFRSVYQTTSYGGLKRYYDAVFTPEQWLSGSPITHAERLTIPALMVVGEQDTFCPPEEGRSYARASGAQLLTFPAMPHEPDEATWTQIFHAVQELVRM